MELEEQNKNTPPRNSSLKIGNTKISFLKENPYGGLFDWYKQLEVDNKQGMIRVEDANEIIKSLSLKSYEGGYKMVIVWMAEKMNVTADILELLNKDYSKE